ncbi:hypothetical protein CRENPOLYSF2_1810002 [Crenothrix polyspora]|uniref:Uncharacterized protein n=1 Tax=Crenothrix polyspora TaxID=360316 RepID=A0A1R4H3Y4_9GAMM|nr:hypothetical protein CRENPOLYSF2_1810002 [Crenothrix polyspora]
MINRAQRICAWASFREKYTCPDEGVLRLDISPSTQTEKKCVASKTLVSRLSCETVRILRGVKVGEDVIMIDFIMLEVHHEPYSMIQNETAYPKQLTVRKAHLQTLVFFTSPSLPCLYYSLIQLVEYWHVFCLI